MNATELRLGNLVQYVDTKEPCTIYEIEHRFKKIYRINDLNDNKNIEPIPITEEWLLKIGFKRVEWSSFAWYHENDIDAIFQIELNSKGPLHIWDGAYTDASCQYIHQLQNLFFALTGKELEFKK